MLTFFPCQEFLIGIRCHYIMWVIKQMWTPRCNMPVTLSDAFSSMPTPPLKAGT